VNDEGRKNGRKGRKQWKRKEKKSGGGIGREDKVE